jgi:hypothetical protein
VTLAGSDRHRSLADRLGKDGHKGLPADSPSRALRPIGVSDRVLWVLYVGPAT